MFAVWGHAILSLVFLLALLFKSTQNAVVLTYFLVIVGALTFNMVNSLFWWTSSPPLLIYLYPPMAFYRCLFVLLRACVGFSCLQPRALAEDPDFYVPLAALAIMSNVLFVTVLIARPVWNLAYACLRRGDTIGPGGGVGSHSLSIAKDDCGSSAEGASTRSDSSGPSAKSDSAIIIRELSKVYPVCHIAIIPTVCSS